VAYVGYPLVLDTTSGKACYSATPKASDDAAVLGAGGAADSADGATSTGPAIPMCGK
jgi:hypothetical protein